jgi:hypothetical protein
LRPSSAAAAQSSPSAETQPRNVMNAGVFGAASIEAVDLDDQRTNHVRLANPTHQHPRRTRTPSHPRQATMVGEYEQLAVQYLEMARGITGDPIKTSCSIGSGYATLALLEQLRCQS